MSTSFVQVTPSVAAYLRDQMPPEPPLLARLREETLAMPMGLMQISPEQGRFMQLLVRLTGTRRYLEVGTFTGYSALSVALALPADGRAICCDVSEEWTAVARRYWREAGVAAKITLRLAPAKDTLDGLIADGGAGSFDMAFVDADKENYGTYYDQALTLLRPNGLLLVDNMLWGGKVADPADQRASTNVIRALNARAAADPRVEPCLLPVGDGLLLLRKN
ncbi:MAG: class I SAM-dependent methyltransferase [Alphaproteobacteria bacterium]|nr:class I SAM-dependent methyltransferase [Alphaproteobacteria bacterium]